MTESRIEKFARIGQELSAAVDEMRAEAVNLTPDLVTGVSKAICAGRGYEWGEENVPGPYHWESYAEPALDFLADTGRLVPEGGRVLTAEQVEDVRTVAWYTGSGLGRAPLAEIHRLRALFPATEPAEEVKPISWYRTMTPKFATAHFGFPGVIGSSNKWTHTASDGGKWAWDGGEWELREYLPAPAVPAEEETKAERRSFPTIQDVPKHTLFHTHGGNGSSLFVRNHFGELKLSLGAPPYWSKPMVESDFLPPSGPFIEVPWPDYFDSYPPAASSPVVPAPIETGPHIGGAWLTDGQAKDAEMILRMVSINHHFSEWARNRCREISTALAPFVAAEEGDSDAR